MSAGTLIVIGLLTAAFGGFIRIWTHTEPEDPPGVIIIQGDTTRRWYYLFEDPRAMHSGEYITRNSAIRAANAELDRLAQKDATTS